MPTGPSVKGSTLTRLVMLTGPMAAGKSTIARELTRQLRALGHDIALTELDEVADMARPTLPNWDWAHHIHAQLVRFWVETGIELVIDDGTSTFVEVNQVLKQLPADVSVFHVVLTVDFDAASARAQADPTRGISKDQAFLRNAYDAWADELPHLPCDLLINTGDVTLQGAVATLIAASSVTS